MFIANHNLAATTPYYTNSPPQLESPAWDSTDLAAHCDHLNTMHGTREQHYLALLEKFFRVDLHLLSQADLRLFASHLCTILEKMPDEIKKRPAIEECFSELCFLKPSAFQSLQYLCEEVNLKYGKRTVLYQNILEILSAMLSKGIKIEQLEWISRSLSLIYQTMPSDLKTKEALVTRVDIFETTCAAMLENYCVSVSENSGEKLLDYYKEMLQKLSLALDFKETLPELARIRRHFSILQKYIPQNFLTIDAISREIQLIQYGLVMGGQNLLVHLNTELQKTKTIGEVKMVKNKIDKLQVATQQLKPTLNESIEALSCLATQKFSTFSKKN